MVTPSIDRDANITGITPDCHKKITGLGGRSDGMSGKLSHE